jgi:RNA polymerase sigma-70 factor (ECF subfamily)
MNGIENDLIKKYLAGDEESLEILFRGYFKQIYNFIYRYVGNAADAEDIAQEAFIKVWRNLKKFDERKNFKT